MPRDAESLKLVVPWALNGDRTDPDDPSLSPPLDRNIGWPPSFSAAGGNTPRREVVNQLFREITGMLVEINKTGILEYSDQLNYVQGAFVRVETKLYFALRANGPGVVGGAVSPTADGQTAWQVYKGRNVVPAQVGAVVATPGNEQVSLSWALPLDGGQPVSRFHVQYKLSTAQAWSAVIYSADASEVVAALTNGDVYQFRVAAENSIGVGAWSEVVSASPVSGVPAAPEILRATPNDGAVFVDWTDADDGGSAITGHTIQWKSGAQAYSTGRSVTAALSEHLVGGLSNGTEYSFRVRANNANGSSAWSAESSATPAPGFVRITASRTFVWPWRTSRARVVVVGGQGGAGGDGGGGGGGGGSTGSDVIVGVIGVGGQGGLDGDGRGRGANGQDGIRQHTELNPGGGGGAGGEGEDGGDSSVVVNAVTVRSAGGRGGKAGAGGKGGWSVESGQRAGEGGNGGEAGGGGAAGGTRSPSNQYERGFPGEPGEAGCVGERATPVTSELNSLALGTEIAVTVGGGGRGGKAGKGGSAGRDNPLYAGYNGGVGNDGADGAAGEVSIYPLY